MFEVSLKNFRGFRNQKFVSVRPITLLVGENSAGKSSFLAALKYLMDFASGDEGASFNKDPFQLGTFQQISHYRGGKAGRAREFELGIRKNVVRRPFRRRPNTELAEPQEVTFSITFSSSESHAVVSSVELLSNGQGLRIKLDQERLTIEYINPQGKVFSMEDTRSLPRIARADFPRYWPFILRDLQIRLSRKADDEQIALFVEASPDRIAEIVELAESFSSSLREQVEATSAIRTKPLRTYTPGLETRNGEGSHVPFEMAKLYRTRNKEGWKKLKDSIEEFGQMSEMFRKIEIKSFGSSASDPFQIQFSTEGPRTNLVDLGYGTSQVLPILYLIATGTKYRTQFIQQPEVHLHPKAQAALGEYFVQSFKRTGQKFVLETHSDFIVDRIRNAIYRREIQPEDVSLIFFERVRLETCAMEIVLDENGEPTAPPEAYRDFFAREQLRVLGVDDANDN